ncbi:wax ester/triacylglycerol synthase domain-containing protein [Nocardia arizonensis]|uniref:wax ester/triacylglycerol synthase domain-containing protein n=1 Tax=Nocardia arizonensis TaxID=1141647 RepID=UPI0009EA2219|nr:wax ester/triacylglycerol synthase domain-containing protein [Nocardia arizonensis]
MDRRQTHLSQSDLFSWNMERDPALRSTIVTVLLLDVDPDWDRLVRTIDRGTRVVPKLRDRLVGVPFGLTPPRWEADPHFDLHWHVRHAALPRSSNLSAVLEFARTEAMTAFDPIRPLWRTTLLSGLENDASALVLTLHHSLTDGIGGIRIAGEILDLDRAGTERTHPPPPRTDGGGPLRDIALWNLVVGADLLRAGVTATPGMVWNTVAHPVRTVRDGSALIASMVRMVRPITDTLSPVMTARSTCRELAVLDVPVEPLHRAARSVGVTMNDVFLAAVIIGLRTYHRRHGARVDRLRVTMPMSLRRPEDPLGGNKITLTRFALPADIPETGDLVRALHEVIGAWRREPAIPFSNALAAALNRLPVGPVTRMLEHVDFVASNVPGSPVPLYLAGARIDRMYAFGPTIGTAVNVTLTSHVDACCLAINADTAAIPDVGLLSESFAEGFDRVLALADVQHARPGTGEVDASAGGRSVRGSDRLSR